MSPSERAKGADPEPPGGGQPVVLLHGLGRTQLAMLPMALQLRRRGFYPINVTYFGPAGLARSVARVSRILEARLAPFAERAVHFVTHSMGGIVARAYLDRHPRPPLPDAPARMVQIAPPNQGAWLANAVGRVPLLDRLPALRDLGVTPKPGATDRGAVLTPRHDLPAPTGIEVGVIAGQSFGPWHGEHTNDGVVRVIETYLPGARDWILLPHFHSVINTTADTVDNVVAFLTTGQFLPEAPRLSLDAEGGLLLRDPADATQRPLPGGRRTALPGYTGHPRGAP